MITIKKGSKGTEVKVLQYFLNTTADGIFGKNTEALVINFQNKEGLDADGIIGPASWVKIAEKMPTIRVGSNGNTVKAWQAIVNTTEDGEFGNKTKAATIAYQTAAKLSPDGVVGPKTWKEALTGTTAAPATGGAGASNGKPVDYKQYDSKWASVVYTKNNRYNKSQTIKSSGCGPTAMADIVATWWDKNVTPVTLAALSVANGYRTENSGTAWGFFKFCAEKYKASKFIQTSSVATLKSALQDGAYAIVSFGPSKWTSGGHYCCIWKWDGSYFYINDPASASSSRAKGTSSEVTSARKQFFIFYK